MILAAQANGKIFWDFMGLKIKVFLILACLLLAGNLRPRRRRQKNLTSR
jgi:hypothetical protein